jgi:threonine/homoserine/homoserine lactone efflux protein
VGALARGLALGFSIAVPVGPIGVLCIRRSIALGRVDGLVTGLGAATADATYGAVAAFGITAVSRTLVAYAFALHVAGGIFLIALGARAFLAPRARVARAPLSSGAERPSRAGQYASTVALTLANPTTILSFAAAYVALGLDATRAGAGLFVAGVFAGSAAWWLLLSAAAASLRRRLSEHAIGLVNKVSGALIAGFGVAALVTAR